MNQRAIEDAVGIDAAVAKYMMQSGTTTAKVAMNLLQSQTNFYDPNGFALLKDAVKSCRAEMGEDR